MTSFITVLALAAIGALIGWITNILAIKLLFKPIESVSIMGIKIQGLIPKRREEIAKNIGEIVEDELLSINDILDNVLTEENIEEVKYILKTRTKEAISKKVPSIIIAPFKDKICLYVDSVIDEESEGVIAELTDKMNDKNKNGNGIRLAQIVEEKVNSFELDKIENIIISVAKKELKHIEVLGGVLGFMIGIVQGVMVLVL